MKKMLLVLMLVVLSSFAFAARGDKGEGDFFQLYNEAYTAVETPGMHKSVGLEANELQIVKDLINKGWYEMKMLEADKLKEVFAVDKLLIDGPGNKGQIDKHFENIRKINDKMEKVYVDTKKECEKHMDFSKMK